MQEGKIDKRHGDPDDPEGRNSGQKAVGLSPRRSISRITL